jgi:SAM-dependent methyltransferase
VDPIARFKENAKQTWSSFAGMEMVTGTAAPRLVRFAGIRHGTKVLDVACGTGVVALTAARLGADVTGVDLTPALVEHAKANAALMELPVRFVEGDVEELPFPDASFDVVVSQFGHIFGPRPDVTTREMLRVLRPGGTIAFSTWPPELYVGKFLALVGRHAPTPPPPGISPPPLWGDPNVVRERLGGRVRDLVFDRDAMFVQVLSPRHARVFSEQGLGPLATAVEALAARDPAQLEALRRELEDLISLYFEDNRIRQDYLLSRAVKV